MRAGRRGSGLGAPLVSLRMIRLGFIFPGTVFRPSLRCPGRHVATTASTAFLALLALGPAFAQSSELAGASTSGPSATAKPVTKRPQLPPPLVAPGAAALLGGPEPLQIGGSQGTLSVLGSDPQVPLAPQVPLGGPSAPPAQPAAPRPVGTQAPGAAPLAHPTVVPPGTVSLVLDRRRRLLTVLEKGLPLRRFPVAVGMPGWETPVGTFRVLDKTINPIWEHPEKGTHIASGPANPLGSRWIGFYQDCQGRRGWDGEQMLDVKGCVVAGFHGTPHRWTVGRAVSHGCVRLYDEDVRELFDLVSLGTSLTVLP